MELEKIEEVEEESKRRQANRDKQIPKKITLQRHFSTPNQDVGRRNFDLHGKKISKQPFVIGICGGPSSGKSTVAKLLKERLKNKAEILNLVDFYQPLRGNWRRKYSIDMTQNEETAQEEIERLDREINFDDPEQIDWTLLNQCLEKLISGKPFDKPIYDKTKKQRSQKTEKIHSNETLIVEGQLIFNNADLRKNINLKIFIDADDDVRLSRRVLKEAGKQENVDLDKLQNVLYKYETMTKPAFEKYIEPSKKYADIIIPNYGFTTEELDLDEITIPANAIDMIVQKVEASFIS